MDLFCNTALNKILIYFSFAAFMRADDGDIVTPGSQLLYHRHRAQFDTLGADQTQGQC